MENYNFDEDAIRLELSKKGYNAVKSIKQKGNKSIEVEANKLLPVYIEKNSPLFVSVPVSMVVSVDDKNKIDTIEGGNVSSEVARDAEKFVKTLIDNRQLGGMGEQFQHHTTHIIEVDDEGHKIIKRRGFRSY